MIARRFGSVGGLVRFAWGHVRALGLRRVDPSSATRLVFVCHGNTCRSAYAEARATKLGVRAASFGLRTTAGMGAHPPIASAAWMRGLDLAAHRATPVEAFVPQAGDLYLAMEPRHVAALRADPRFAKARIDLLGRYGGTPHIEDPFGASAGYVGTCLERIDRAVRALVVKSRAARG